jgi:hypothetical protein
VHKDSGNNMNRRSRNSFSTPQKHSQEFLQGMNEDRLEALKGMLKGKIFSLTKMLRGNDKSVEEDLASTQTEHSYISRELEIRYARKKIHEEYLQRTRKYRTPPRRTPRTDNDSQNRDR